MLTPNPAMAVDSMSTMTPEAREYGKQIFATIASEFLGFKLNTLKYYLNGDLHFNPDYRAQEVGYANLQELLESKEMESLIYWRDERNEHGEVSRVYRARPNDDYADIYDEQRKSHITAKKKKERQERMYEREYGVKKAGPASSNQQQGEHPNRDGHQGWGQNSQSNIANGRINDFGDADRFREEHHHQQRDNLNGDTGNKQRPATTNNNNDCSSSSSSASGYAGNGNGQRQQQQKPKQQTNSSGQNDICADGGYRMPAPNRLPTKLHYQGLGEPAGLDDFDDDSSDDDDEGAVDKFVAAKFGKNGAKTNWDDEGNEEEKKEVKPANVRSAVGGGDRMNIASTRGGAESSSNGGGTKQGSSIGGNAFGTFAKMAMEKGGGSQNNVVGAPTNSMNSMEIGGNNSFSQSSSFGREDAKPRKEQKDGRIWDVDEEDEEIGIEIGGGGGNGPRKMDIWDEHFGEENEGEEADEENCRTPIGRAYNDYGGEEEEEDEDDDYRTVMGDNDSDDPALFAAGGNRPFGRSIAHQNGGNVGVGHPLLQNRNTHSGSHQAFMHSAQFQQNQQTMEYSQRKPQTVQQSPPLHHQSMPHSMHKLHLDAEKANNAQRANQRQQEDAMAKAKKGAAVPEAILVDYNTSPLDFQQSTSASQLLMNNNATANLLADFGPSKMGDGWAGGTGSIAISAPSLASLTSASSYFSIPQFELPEDWSEISHPNSLVPAECVLLLCDVQEGYKQKVRHFAECLKVIGRMVKTAKLLGIQIIGTEQQNCGVGSVVNEMKKSAIPIVPKTKFSMCIPPLRRQIPKEAKTVILCGFETHCAIQQSAFDFQSIGLNVHIILDGTSSGTMQNRLFAFKQMERGDINLTTSESAILGLVGDSGHEKFNEVQKIINREPASDTGLLKNLPAF